MTIDMTKAVKGATLEIGQWAWFANYSMKEKWVQCPDCLGQKALTIIMGDGTRHSIDCVNCKRGYENSTGFVRQYDYEETAERVLICGVIKNLYDKVEYRSDNRHMDGEDVFLCRDEALKRAKEKGAKEQALENERQYQKHDRNRTWAWNASYHRGCIRKTEKDLAYHTSMLNVAKAKSKEVSQ